MRYKAIVLMILVSLLSPVVIKVGPEATILMDNSTYYTGNNTSNDCYTGVDAADGNVAFHPTWIANGSNLSTVGGTCSGTLNDSSNDDTDKYNLQMPAGKYLNLSVESAESIYFRLELCTNQTGHCQNPWLNQQAPTFSQGVSYFITTGGNFPWATTGYSVLNSEWITIYIYTSSTSNEFVYNLTFTYHNLSDLPPHPGQNDFGSGQDAGIIYTSNEYELEINLTSSNSYELNGWSHGDWDTWDVVNFDLPQNYGFNALLTLNSGNYYYDSTCESDGGNGEWMVMDIANDERSLLIATPTYNAPPHFQFNQSYVTPGVLDLTGDEVNIMLRNWNRCDNNGTFYTLTITLFSIDDDGDGWNNFLEEECGTDSDDSNSVPDDLDNDGICDFLDADDDGDGVGDNEDDFPEDPTEWDDSDGDGVGDNSDEFPYDANETTDFDGDGIGDNGDEDDDDDGWSDYEEGQCYSDQYDNNSTPSDIDSDGLCDEMDSDTDGDGFSNADETNNCGESNDPLDAADTPTDTDGDMLCDGVDGDDDNDGWHDLIEESCLSNQTDPSDGPIDSDSDSVCDPMDLDDDNDGYHDEIDDLPLNSSEWLDTDADGLGNNADPDDDGDGWPDTTEMACGGYDPLDHLSSPPDNDADGICDVMDLDDDNDSHLDSDDEFPFDSRDWVDTDQDGMGDNTDPDDDNDMVPDAYDAFPLDPSESVDTDEDGIGDNSDDDDDGDGWTDSDEVACSSNPLDYSNQPHDEDGDHRCNEMDDDDDGDGHLDSEDLFPLDSDEWGDNDGDGIGDNSDEDDDNDGLSDETEISQSSDPYDKDTDDDGKSDAVDAFPIDPTEWLDSDGDGIGDNSDPTPDGPIDDGGGLPGFGLIAGLVALCLGAVAHRIRRS